MWHGAYSFLTCAAMPQGHETPADSRICSGWGSPSGRKSGRAPPRHLPQKGYWLRMCVKNARDHIKRGAALEMEDGPPKPACRSRLKTTISRVGQKPGW